MPSSRLELVFRGRVQGVGFRARAAAVAARHGVTGWVRNEPDGSVSCVAEGESGEEVGFLKDLLAEMSRYIASHEVKVHETERRFSSFTIQ